MSEGGGSDTVSDPRPTTHPESLRQYALLADGERGALVGPRGDMAFLCPHPHHRHRAHPHLHAHAHVRIHLREST